ncbi:uncharacterized protein LOC110887033 [Helianthus annuus]|uniref:uncharacterized protein LOC110887033 n=1 Tax=Helianthus annuus TaxID=4232 RepID=UPI000B8FE0E1|nr:uncharacterized protein LOC110887033 [Helianthus annuus]
MSVSDEIVAEAGTGNTVKVKFWIDNWCNGKRFKERFPGLFKIARNKQVKVAKCVTKLENENQWNLGWVRPPNSDAEWAQWWNMLYLPNNVRFKPESDTWMWKLNNNGEFTVAAIPKQIVKEDVLETADEWKHWNSWIPPKVNYFTWRAAIERIPVKKELIKRRIPIDNQLCLRCEEEEESADHVICGCIRSKPIWKSILVWLKVPTYTQFERCTDVLEHVTSLSGSKEWKKVINTVLQTTMWNLWKARNEMEFKGNIRSGNNIVENIMADSFIWLKSKSKIQNIVWERWVDFNIRDIVK